jgi:hypothetical protein
MWASWVLLTVAWPRPSSEAGAALSSSSPRPTDGSGVHRPEADGGTEADGGPFIRLSVRESSAKAVYKAGGHCQGPTESDVSRIAVNFYGLWRTVAHVLPLLERNVVAPSRSVGLVDIFVHATTEATLTNARSGEEAVSLDPHAALEIKSCDTVIEDTAEVDHIHNIESLARDAHGTVLDSHYPYETVRNVIRARYSMMSVMQLAARREHAAHFVYTHFALVRPDVAVLAPIDWRDMRQGEIRVPNSNDFYGLDDKLAYGSRTSLVEVFAGMWDDLISGTVPMDADRTAEQLLCYQLARHNVPVSLQPACLARVRADSVIEEKDLLATPKRPTDLKCTGRKGKGLPDHLKLNLVKRPTDWSHGCPALHDFVQQHGGHTDGIPGNLDSTLKLAEVAERADAHVGFTPWQSFQGADETALPSQTAPCMVVLAYDRPDLLHSLLRRLNTMHYGADLGRVALTISIDAAPPDASQDVRSRVDLSVGVARNFSFNAGVSRLRVRTSHAGMVGQWLDAWRPELDATDKHMACAILEDDLVPSRSAWHWMQGALDAYGNHLGRLASLSWQRQKLVAATQSDRELGVMPPDTGGQPFMYRLLGTWGFVALRQTWISFRRYFFQRVVNGPPPSFEYRGAKLLPFVWFDLKPPDSMWSIWFIQFMADNDLFTLYANLDAPNNTLCENARPLHGVNANPNQAPDFQVLDRYDPALDRFPPFNELRMFDWDAREAWSRMRSAEKHRRAHRGGAFSTRFRRARLGKGGALCTMAGSRNIPELGLMLRSFFVVNEDEPQNVSGVLVEPMAVFVDADDDTAAWLHGSTQISKSTALSKTNARRLSITTGLQQFAGYSKEELQAKGLWLSVQRRKIGVLRAALEHGCSFALWADADILFLAPLPWFDQDLALGLSPHYINAERARKSGYFNAGYILVRSTEPLDEWEREMESFLKEDPSSTTPDQVPLEAVSSVVPHFTFEPGENLGWWQLIASHNREQSDMLDRFACQAKGATPWGELTFNGHTLRSLHFHTSLAQTGPEGPRHFDLGRTLHLVRYILEDCQHPVLLALIEEAMQREISLHNKPSPSVPVQRAPHERRK